VESGTNVICPSFLAQEKMVTVETPLLTVLHGSLEMHGASVTGFYPDHQPRTQSICNIGETSLPADASDTNTFEYFYTRTQEGACYYSVRAAGHPLLLETIALNITDVHHYESHLAVSGWKSATKQWDKLAPNHTYRCITPPRKQKNRIFLAHKNEAGRLLALSNSRGRGVVFCPDGEDYLGAWGYAETSGYHTLIL
jgi:hypothetical protein